MPKSLRIKARGEVEIVDRPMPTPGQNQILVKNIAVAQNPIDWQCVYDYFVPGSEGALIGNDFAGVVIALGQGVTRYKSGDRVAGIAPGNINQSPDGGAFAEFVIGDEDLSFKIPDGMSFEDASTFGTAITTVGQSLYQSLDLPWPTEPAGEPLPVLIHGGSSAMGSLAIQFAKLSGCKVITTASPKNFDFVKAMGADEVFDYRDANIVTKIKAASDNKLTKAFDTICLPGTTSIVTESFGPTGGKMHNLRHTDMTPFRKDVTQTVSGGYAAFGLPWSLQGHAFPGLPENRIHSTRFWKLADELLAGEKLQPHPIKVLAGGLEGVSEGLKMQKEWKLSAEKLVYLIGYPGYLVQRLAELATRSAWVM